MSVEKLLYASFKNIYAQKKEIDEGIRSIQETRKGDRTTYDRLGAEDLINKDIVTNLPIVAKYCLVACYLAATYSKKNDARIMGIKTNKKN